MDHFSDLLTLEGAGRRQNDTRTIFRVPLKTLGYNGSNELCGKEINKNGIFLLFVYIGDQASFGQKLAWGQF